MALQLTAFDLQLALQELGLRRHRHVLAGSHRERPRDQARQSGEQDHGGKRIRTGDTEDQRDIGEQAVADAEHRGARGATLEIAVVRTFMRQTVLAGPADRGNPLGHKDSMPTS